MTEHDTLSQTLYIFGLIKYVQLTLLHCLIVCEFRRYSPLNGDALEYVDNVKYLGVLLSHDMKDDADMSRHLRSFYARSNVIFRKFHHCSASIKVNLIKTYCAPYCSQLWVNHTKGSYNKLRVAYNNAYRRVIGYVKSDSASNMFVNNQVENFDAHNRHLIYIV